MNQSEHCYYKILNVTPQASDEEIKQAYLILAKIYHPDQNPRKTKAAHQRFQMINEAYEQLKTRERRRRYNHIKKLKADNDNIIMQQNTSWIDQLADIFRPRNHPA